MPNAARGRYASTASAIGKADLFGDMALRIEKAFGVKMDTLCVCNPPTMSLACVRRKFMRAASTARLTLIHDPPLQKSNRALLTRHDNPQHEQTPSRRS
jgi:hypothetical protein